MSTARRTPAPIQATRRRLADARRVDLRLAPPSSLDDARARPTPWRASTRRAALGFAAIILLAAGAFAAFAATGGAARAPFAPLAGGAAEAPTAAPPVDEPLPSGWRAGWGAARQTMRE